MPSWPDELYLITHAECDASGGELRREAGLSARGQMQARELGRWFGAHVPSAVWSSPFRCARETARIAIASSETHAAVIVDERLALSDPSQVLHDAGALVDALRATGLKAARIGGVTAPLVMGNKTWAIRLV